jgi:hypothetical protein
VSAAPTGTLTKKIHRHDPRSVRTPPSRSPTVPLPAEIALQIARAFARSFASLNVVVMIDSTAGTSSAPPSPCNPRPAISIAGDCAKPLSSDAAEKSTIPAPNTRLRPITSPARPPNSMKPPKISVYIMITRCRLDAPRCRPRWIDGSATLTIVASRTTMNCATHTMTTTSHGLLLSAVPSIALMGVLSVLLTPPSTTLAMAQPPRGGSMNV